MPNVFTRVKRALSRRRDDSDDQAPTPKATVPPPIDTARSGSQDVLGGPYETISPNASPSAAQFEDIYRGDKSKSERGRKGLPGLLNRFTSSSSTSIPATSPIINSSKRSNEFLQLPAGMNGDDEEDGSKTPTTASDAKNRSTTATSFAEEHVTDKKAVHDRILTAEQDLPLIKATAALISERGLETLGIFKPHWYSASRERQARIISLFFATLDKPADTPGLAPTTTAISQAFESELYYCDNPHDIAEVLKWALRHLKLESGCFGEVEGQNQWKWYQRFSEAEKESNYAPDAFSKALLPALPPDHADLLKIVLDLTSSVASHADSNAMSGSKLSKVLGWWLLSSREVPSDHSEWTKFYSEWETSARVLEHLFFAFLRDLGSTTALPKRLQELVSKYPFGHLTSANDGFLLPKPRFSTRSYPALLVQLIHEKVPKQTSRTSLVTLIEEALAVDPISADPSGTGAYFAVWTSIRQQAIINPSDETTPTALSPSPSPGNGPNFALNQVFADETLSVLSLESEQGRRPSVSIFSTPDVVLSKPPTQRSRRSFSMNDMEYTGPPAIMAAVADHDRSVTVPTVESPGDWGDFATGGFGATSANGTGLAATLKGFDKGANGSTAEASEFGRKSSIKPSGSRTRRTASPKRVSMDGAVLNNASSSPDKTTTPAPRPARIAVYPTTVEIDEAFIDVWADNIQDSVPAANWPTFALCQLKTPASIDGAEGESPKSVRWIVIQQVYVDPPKPAPAENPIAPLSPSKRPTPSIKGRNRLSGFIPGFRSRQSTDQGPQLEPSSPIRTSSSVGGITRVLSRSASKKRLRAESGVKDLGESVKEEVPPMPTAPEKVPLPSDITPMAEKSAEEATAPASSALGMAAAAVGGGIALVGAGVGALTSVLSTGLSPAAATASETEKTPKPAAAELASDAVPTQADVEPVEQPTPEAAKPNGYHSPASGHVEVPHAGTPPAVSEHPVAGAPHQDGSAALGPYDQADGPDGVAHHDTLLEGVHPNVEAATTDAFVMANSNSAAEGDELPDKMGVLDAATEPASEHVRITEPGQAAVGSHVDAGFIKAAEAEATPAPAEGAAHTSSVPSAEAVDPAAEYKAVAEPHVEEASQEDKPEPTSDDTAWYAS